MTKEEIEKELERLDQLSDQIWDAKYKADKESRHLSNLIDQVENRINELRNLLNLPTLEP
jgi:transcription elongation GreA/GreB family factor